jgi:cardiolipin synthase
LRIPNLLSLSRIALVPAIAWCLAQQSDGHTLAAVGLLTVAGITDGLDGYLARRFKQVTPLGIALDPVSDKIFAAGLVASLMIWRDFPLWLAIVIVGRDLLILVGGWILLSGRKLTLPANLTGKYTFGAIVMLLVSHVVGFPFGISLFTWLVTILVAVSLIIYGRVFAGIRGNRPTPVFVDTYLHRAVRVTAAVLIAIVYLVRLYLDVLK